MTTADPPTAGFRVQVCTSYGGGRHTLPMAHAWGRSGVTLTWPLRAILSLQPHRAAMLGGEKRGVNSPPSMAKDQQPATHNPQLAARPGHAFNFTPSSNWIWGFERPVRLRTTPALPSKEIPSAAKSKGKWARKIVSL